MREDDSVPGMRIITLSKWDEFKDVAYDMKLADQYSWRGQGDSVWKLETTFDREIPSTMPYGYLERKLKQHIARFKYLARGRTEFDNYLYPHDDKEEITQYEWWSLGQHFGLKTPLLDWTYSPFVALFFAVQSRLPKGKGKAAVWGIGNVKNINKIISDKKFTIKNYKRDEYFIFKFFPKQRTNQRIIAQNGHFTASSIGIPIEILIQEASRNYDHVNLIKIIIPFNNLEEIKNCLIFLERMNINPTTMFPDISGSAMAANLALTIDKYHRFW